MFEDGYGQTPGAGGTGPAGMPTPAPLPVVPSRIAAIREVLGRLDPHAGPGLTQQQCIEALRELEDLKAAAAGAQVAVTAHLAQARSDAEQAAGVPARERRRGLATEVALARRVSPHCGGRHLGLAMTLRADMPHTLNALRRGRLSEWRATLLVRESICLDAADRRAFDAQMCSDADRFAAWGDKQVVAEAKKVAYRLDPHSVVERAARAERDRCVTVRPAPDTMAYLTALLPMTQAVAAHAALTAAADSARSAGDGRSRGQVMADTLVGRVTGRDPANPADLHVQLVMSDRSLLQGGAEPADVLGYGPVPSAWARELVRRALAEGGDEGLWVHRLFTDTADRLVAMESRGRTAPPGLAGYLALRDGGTCRTPYCDAPIRHTDHVVPVRAGGPTHAQNLQGQCERCNYTKDLPGWRAATHSRGDPPSGRDSLPDSRSDPPEVITTTPTGHSYRSPPPTLPRVG